MQISTSWQDEGWHYADTACRRIAALLPMLPAEYGKHMFTYGQCGEIPPCRFVYLSAFFLSPARKVSGVTPVSFLNTRQK